MKKSGTRKQQRRINYVCGCPSKVHEITMTRHRKVLRGASYSCRGCGERIYKEGTTKPAKPTYNFG